LGYGCSLTRREIDERQQALCPNKFRGQFPTNPLNTGRLFGLCFYIDRFCKEAQLFVSGFLFVQGQSKKFGCFFLSQQFCKSLHRAVTSHLIVFDALGRRDDPGIHYLSRRILCGDPFLAQYYFHATFPSLRSWEEGRRSPNSHTAAILEKFLLDHPTGERPKK
jgi:hypothetical protein